MALHGVSAHREFAIFEPVRRVRGAVVTTGKTRLGEQRSTVETGAPTVGLSSELLSAYPAR